MSLVKIIKASGWFIARTTEKVKSFPSIRSFLRSHTKHTLAHTNTLTYSRLLSHS